MKYTTDNDIFDSYLDLYLDSDNVGHYAKDKHVHFLIIVYFPSSVLKQY